MATPLALAKKINTEHYAGEDAAGQAMEHFIKCGEYLIEAKAQVKHGEWLQWVKDHLDFTDQTARNYMSIASNSKRVLDLGITTMVEALAEVRAEKRAKREINELLAFATDWNTFFEANLVSVFDNANLALPTTEEEVNTLIAARDNCYELAEFFDEHIPVNTKSE
jgi:hypothetical protein